jgi:hypothetical protein
VVHGHGGGDGAGPDASSARRTGNDDADAKGFRKGLPHVRRMCGRGQGRGMHVLRVALLQVRAASAHALAHLLPALPRT